MPLFSIIVPVYKTEKYLKQCIDSIIGQNYTDFELILVDDGSPDKCGQICDDYASVDDRIKVIHKSNGGVSSARNAGLECANGKYIWFVDSDDSICENALATLYNEQISNKCDIYVFNNETYTGVSDINLNDFFHGFYFKYAFGFNPWNKIYRLDIIAENDIVFDTEETIGEDLLFNILYYSHFLKNDKIKIDFIGTDLYNYTDRDGSAMNTRSKYKIVNQMRLFDKIKHILGDAADEKITTYLFLMHLVQGIGQSAHGGLPCKEFAEIIDFEKYLSEIKRTKTITKEFFKNEHASFLGKLRIKTFLLMMKTKKYKLAGFLMGLR